MDNRFKMDNNHIVYTLASPQPTGSMRGPGMDINQTLPGQFQFPNPPGIPSGSNINPYGNTVHHYMLPKQSNYRGGHPHNKTFNVFPPPPPNVLERGLNLHKSINDIHQKHGIEMPPPSAHDVLPSGAGIIPPPNVLERGLNLHKPATDIQLKTSTEMPHNPPEVIPSSSAQQSNQPKSTEPTDKVSSVVGAASEALAMLCNETNAIPEEFTITIYDANQDIVDPGELSLNRNNSTGQSSESGTVVTCITFTEENTNNDAKSDSQQKLAENEMKVENKNETNDIDDLLEVFPFICGFCHKRFNRIHKYFEHVASHEENRDEFYHVCEPKDDEAPKPDSAAEVKYVYSCGVCNKVFKTICHLNDHIINEEQLDRYVVKKAKYSDKTEDEDDSYYQHPRKRFTKKAVKRETKTKKTGAAKRKPWSIKRGRKPKYVMVDDDFDDESSEGRIERKAVSRYVKPVRTPEEHQEYLKKKRMEYRRRVEKKKRLREEARQRRLLGAMKKKAPSEKTNEEGEEEGADQLGSIDTEILESLTESKKESKKAQLPKKPRKKYTRRKKIEADEKLGNQMAVCHKCGNMYKRSQLAGHMAIHKEERKHICKICNKAFKARHQIATHMVSHSSEKNFACEICGRCFKTAATRNQHQKRHSAVKNIPCPMCPMMFNHNGILKSHLLTHSDEKPHICEMCGKGFRRSDLLIKHRLCHTDVRPFSCDQCGRAFKSTKDLKKHQKIHQPHGYFCPICDKSFVNGYKRNMHLKTHMKPVVTYPPGFDNMSHMQQQQHMQDHTRPMQDHTRSMQDHTRPLQDHTRQLQDHTRPLQDHTRPLQDHTRQLQELTRPMQDHARVCSPEMTINHSSVLNSANSINRILY